ncbi:hypothetical protein SESBI_39603 [Sesbania bispinosa]|nr:hypothetical protein SESBI_39603 [Sesbania bispinosa]
MNPNSTTRCRGVNSGGGSGRNIRFCNCGRKVVVRTSKTKRNPGRRNSTPVHLQRMISEMRVLFVGLMKKVI